MTIGAWMPAGIADGVDAGDNLRNRQVDVHVRLKIDLLDGDARQSLALDIANIVDAGADRIFAIGSDALFHLLRSEPRILPDDGHNRDVDIWKNVLWGRQDSAAAKEKHHQGKHIERVPETKREANDTDDLALERRRPRALGV